jgi:transposase InsO family protein
VLSAHPGQVAGAATNNAELAAHQSERPAHPRLPSTSPCPGTAILPTGPDAVSSRDNGAAYIAHDYARALHELGLKHLRITPGRPRTNGKAERLIQTLLNEWAYARVYGSSTERTEALHLYLDRYNYRRPHGSLNHQPPASRLNHVVGNYT